MNFTTLVLGIITAVYLFPIFTLALMSDHTRIATSLFNPSAILIGLIVGLTAGYIKQVVSMYKEYKTRKQNYEQY